MAVPPLGRLNRLRPPPMGATKVSKERRRAMQNQRKFKRRTAKLVSLCHSGSLLQRDQSASLTPLWLPSRPRGQGAILTIYDQTRHPSHRRDKASHRTLTATCLCNSLVQVTATNQCVEEGLGEESALSMLTSKSLTLLVLPMFQACSFPQIQYQE